MSHENGGCQGGGGRTGDCLARAEVLEREVTGEGSDHGGAVR